MASRSRGDANGILSGLLRGVLSALSGAPKAREDAETSRRPEAPLPAQGGGTATIEIDAPAAENLVITYAPERDGEPDAGEVVWTWVPYAERDGRGKDRPVLVIGRESDERAFAVRLTSKSHDGDRDFLSIGAGPWDSQGRPSWVDIDQVYSVHRDGMRREASALDLDRFTRVAHALQQRYGWRVGPA